MESWGSDSDQLPKTASNLFSIICWTKESLMHRSWVKRKKWEIKIFKIQTEFLRSGVWMKHDVVEGDVAGDLMLGGYDHTKFTGTIYYTPITRQGYWQFNMDSISVSGQTVNAPNGSWKTISDTGTSLAAGPTFAVDTIGTQLGGQFNPFVGLVSRKFG